MLKFTTCIFIIAVLWGSVTLAKIIEGEVGYCNYNGLKIKEGTSLPAPIGECAEVICKEAKTDLYLAFTCPEWQLNPESKCHKSKKDLTKQYPDCCPEEVCDEE